MENTVNIHPSYTFSDADLVLSSRDGVQFQVHSTVLRLASSFFLDMLGVQRASEEGCKDPIAMSESTDAVKALLDVVYPNRSITSADIKSFEFLADLVAMFVGKYDVPAGVSVVRAFFHDSRLAKTLPPIKLFGLAKQYGWADEAATTSIQSLALDLYSEDAQMQLSGLDTRSALDLINLHRNRRKDFLDALLAPTAPSTSIRPRIMWSYDNICNGNVFHSRRCGQLDFRDTPQWSSFKHAVSEELDVCASGDGIRGYKFWGRPDVTGLWDIRCTSCKEVAFSKDAFAKSICDVLDELPKSAWVATPLESQGQLPHTGE